MVFALFTLLTALTMSGLAAWYSIEGLVSIYTAMPLKVMLLAGIIEICKLVAASWIYHTWEWSKTWIRSALAIMVLGVMIVTSIGIFGLLSKAHEDTLAKSSVDIQAIALIDSKITSENRKIARLNTIINQLDKSIDIYFNKEYITRGLRERDKQKPQRDQINQALNEHAVTIDMLIDKKQPMIAKITELEHEIGPLKAVAELVFGEKNSRSHFNDAVRWLTILLVILFDPFAILLIIAANMTIAYSKTSEKKTVADELVDKVLNKMENLTPDVVKKKNIENDIKEQPQPIVEEELSSSSAKRKADWYERWQKKQEMDLEHLEVPERRETPRDNLRSFIDPLLGRKKD